MKRWLLLGIAIVFTALGVWMLVDTLRHPAGAKPGQLWMALSILLLFGAAGLLFGFQILTETRRGRGAADEADRAPADGALLATYSKVWLAIGVGVCSAFALAGLFMFAAGLSGLGIVGIIVGLLAAIVFGSFAVIGLVQLGSRGWSARRIRIDAAGIRDSSIGDRLIGWDEIAVIARRTLYGQRLVEVRLRDPAAYVADITGLQRPLARLNLAFGFAPYSITLTGLNVDEADLIAAVDRFKPGTLLLLGGEDA